MHLVSIEHSRLVRASNERKSQLGLRSLDGDIFSVAHGKLTVRSATPLILRHLPGFCSGFILPSAGISGVCCSYFFTLNLPETPVGKLLFCSRPGSKDLYCLLQLFPRLRQEPASSRLVFKVSLSNSTGQSQTPEQIRAGATARW